MANDISLPSAARGITMHVTRSPQGPLSYSVSLYQALATPGQPLVQLAYAVGDALELIAQHHNHAFALWLSEDGRRRVCFELTADAAAAVADFAGIALPAALEAA